jgi:hypothetical protein
MILILLNNRLQPFGEDTFIRNLSEALSILNSKVTLTTENDYEVFRKPDVVILHNVSFFKYGFHFKRLGCKVVAPLYFSWNNDLNFLENFKSLAENVINQAFVDKYIVTHERLLREFNIKGVKKNKLHLIEPYYHCQHCDHLRRNLKGKFKNLESEVKLIYLGPISHVRVPLKDILRELNKLSKLKVSFKLYSTRIVPDKPIAKDLNYRKGNVEISIISKKLSDVEKHEALSSSHFFLFTPNGNVTMNPSMSLLEAIYHLTIPIVSDKLSGSEYLPKINIVKNTSQIASRIIRIKEMLMKDKYPLEALLDSFSRFYDKGKFLHQVKTLIEELKCTKQ